MFCFTCHDSIHFSGSRQFRDSSHVMAHVELAVACAHVELAADVSLRPRMETFCNRCAVSHVPTGLGTSVE